ncbi:hypothetical protein I4U23_000159 [Adineta vaga]|nr:hypothetical protein I4U23_000159 [Adineta vaga]
MRRDGKYGSNKTIRFCTKCSRDSSHSESSCNISLDKGNRWKLIDLLKKFSQSPDGTNKKIIRHNYNFYQYNGYHFSARRESKPPKHMSFPKRPDFVYQPHVKCLKINHDIFNWALQNGSRFFRDKTNLERILDIHSPDIPVTIIYFMDGSQHCFPLDWRNAYRHAFGGYFADYNMLCTGDYCPFGPKIRGLMSKETRIDEVLFLCIDKEHQGRKGCCHNVAWRCVTRATQHGYKEGRHRIKTQRREGNRLTKEAISTRASFQ